MSARSIRAATRLGPVLLVLAAGVVFALRFAQTSQAQRGRGFEDVNLSNCIIPRSEILAGGPPKDGIPALTDPKTVPAADADYLRRDDKVIGVELEGAARAYPLRVLVWHENANDVLGGRPIAVTYCPLCHSAFVFDRRVDGEVRQFGISGRLWNSNVLLYDRQDTVAEESLWSQVLMKAVCGPAAEKGLKLEPLPSELVTWGDWRRRHPETTVLSKSTGHRRNYVQNPYAAYFRTERLMFPVSASEAELRGHRNKEVMVIVRVGEAVRAYAVSDVERAAGKDGTFEDRLGGGHVRFHYAEEGKTVRVEPVSLPTGDDFAVAYTFWFAWRAMHPQGDLFRPDGTKEDAVRRGRMQPPTGTATK